MKTIYLFIFILTFSSAFAKGTLFSTEESHGRPLSECCVCQCSGGGAAVIVGEYEPFEDGCRATQGTCENSQGVNAGKIYSCRRGDLWDRNSAPKDCIQGTFELTDD